jgi:hypothetical protein
MTLMLAAASLPLQPAAFGMLSRCIADRDFQVSAGAATAGTAKQASTGGPSRPCFAPPLSMEAAYFRLGLGLLQLMHETICFT